MRPRKPPTRSLPGIGHRLTRKQARRLTSMVRSVPTDFGGGASAAKVLAISDLMIRFDVHDAVEIGVYRGRFLLPIAEALRFRGAGRVIGIDPWSAAEALQRDDHEVGPVVNEFVRAHPWEDIYESLVARIDKHGLGSHVELMRMTSRDAAERIPDRSVGLVHVDGNHDADAVELDVRLYEPKLRPGGLLVLDDTLWASVQPTVAELRARLRPILHMVDLVGAFDDEQPSDFVVFRIGNASGE